MKRKVNVLIIIFLFIVYLEFIFKLFVFESFFNYSLINIILFSLATSIFIYLLGNFFNKKINQIIITTILSIITIIFISQFIFYKIFDSFFSFLSTDNAHAIVEFFSFVAAKILSNITAVLLLLLPLILFLFLKNKFFNFQRKNIKFKLLLFLFMIGIHILTITILPRNDIYSDYNLYHKVNAIKLMVDRLGLFTSMRLDIKRILFGFNSDNSFIDVTYEEQDNEEKIDKTRYNMLDIDWETLIANETDDQIKQMHEYFSSITPTKKKFIRKLN